MYIIRNIIDDVPERDAQRLIKWVILSVAALAVSTVALCFL